MSRIRSIHPGIYTDEAWASVTVQARWLGMALMTEADDNGIFEWKPLQIKMRIFPADNVIIADLLDELICSNILKQYFMAGRTLGALRNFCKFQKPRKPKAWFPISQEVRNYVGLEDDPEDEPEPAADTPSLFDDETDPSNPAVPQKSEIAPQMEDGGWRMEDGGGRIPLPPYIPPEPEWAEFRRFRKRIGKPLTDHAARLATKRLATYVHEGGDAREIINRSIENGWTALWPQNQRSNGNGYHNGHQPAEQSLRGSRPNPALDLRRQAERELAAERQDEIDHRGFGLALPASKPS